MSEGILDDRILLARRESIIAIRAECKQGILRRVRYTTSPIHEKAVANRRLVLAAVRRTRYDVIFRGTIINEMMRDRVFMNPKEVSAALRYLCLIRALKKVGKKTYHKTPKLDRIRETDLRHVQRPKAVIK